MATAKKTTEMTKERSHGPKTGEPSKVKIGIESGREPLLPIAVMGIAFPAALICLLICFPSGTSDLIKLTSIVLLFCGMFFAVLTGSPNEYHNDLSKALSELISAIALRVRPRGAYKIVGEP
jgi:hypothetical protein